MLKINLIISMCVFSILLTFTSIIKNKTRIIEKNIYKVDKRIALKEKDLNEIELDYHYLSSPSNISNKLNNLAFINYSPMDFSRIYLDYEDFTSAEKKMSILKNNDEKKAKKK